MANTNTPNVDTVMGQERMILAGMANAYFATELAKCAHTTKTRKTNEPPDDDRDLEAAK